MFTKTSAGTSFKHLIICLGSSGHPVIVNTAEALRFAYPGGDTPQRFNGVALSMIALWNNPKTIQKIYNLVIIKLLSFNTLA